MAPNVDVSVYAPVLAEMRPTLFVQLSPSQRTHELPAMFPCLILLVVCGGGCGGGIYVNGRVLKSIWTWTLNGVFTNNWNVADSRREKGVAHNGKKKKTTKQRAMSKKGYPWCMLSISVHSDTRRSISERY